MKIKTSKLMGPALDWAVSFAMGYSNGFPENLLGIRVRGFGHERIKWRPSTDWAQGGPIIDEEKIQWCKLNGQIEAWSGFDYLEWRRDWDSPIRMGEGSGFGTGPTILIAAMRCYVASKLGDEVEVPDEPIGE